ncbi:MAG: GGDEF domain-containing protein [Butyrivibrio sp.]|nr:GGDEF domain-containing protein [Butyrivibrio sp.]
MGTTKRKRIGLFVSFPEIVHVRRITEGIRRRCEQYDYDLCIFAASVHVKFPMDEYAAGETNIYELANFNELDGVILDHATLSGSRDEFVLKRLLERLKDYPDLPVCSLESELEGTTFIGNDNEETLREMCRHVIEFHGKKKICILTGQKGNSVSEKRLDIFLDEIEKHGLSVLPEHIVYGDFWYTSGDRLGEDIADKKLERPEAVLCASDTMALGLIDKLVKRGIKVPEDVIVIGFDSSDEGAINYITLSSFDPNDVDMGERAVDHIRSVIEPGEPLMEKEGKSSGTFHPGASCGCELDPFYNIKRLRNHIHTSTYNYADENSDQMVSVGALMENYVLEKFTASKTVDECIGNIFGSARLLKPFSNLYMCLKEDWLNMLDTRTSGYPEKMSIIIRFSEAGEEPLCGIHGAPQFETARMLPKLDEDRDRPGIFCFLPLHFNGKLLGYTVIERDISESYSLNIVNRNWLRFINNALEMSRSKNRLETLSIRDEMTGAYNRRGMYQYFKEMCYVAKPGDSLFVAVVDMDELKYINDTYGHREGDLGIKVVCSALQETSRDNEICVRSGGDEFFLIGIGKYDKEDEAKRALEYAETVEKRSKQLKKPYNISASIGCVVYEDFSSVNLDNALSEADERMYHYKFRHRKHRSV